MNALIPTSARIDWLPLRPWQLTAFAVPPHDVRRVRGALRASYTRYRGVAYATYYDRARSLLWVITLDGGRDEVVHSASRGALDRAGVADRDATRRVCGRDDRGRVGAGVAPLEAVSVGGAR